MTNRNKENQQEQRVAKPKYEPTYTMQELVDAAADFNTTSIVVRAALTKGGKDAYTMKEAKQLIERMKNKEVRA